jgi:PAS domain S-box-containing protein
MSLSSQKYDDRPEYAAAEQSHLDRIRDILQTDGAKAPETIRRLLKFGTEQLGVDQGLLTRIKPGPGTLEVVEQVGGGSTALSGTTDLSSTFCRRVIAGGEVLGVYDALAEGESSDPAYETHGMRCYIGEKVLVDGELYGTACFMGESPRAEPFSEAEIALVRFVARCVGQELSEWTGRAPSRERLRQDRALLRRVERVAGVGGWEVDLATDQVSWTNEVYRIHEVPLDYVPSVEDGLQFYAPEARPRLREALEQCIDEGIPYDLELPFDTANGTRRWVRTQGERVNDEQGRPVAVVGTIQDVTEWREMRGRLREQRDLLQSINENVSEGIYRFRPGDGIVYANQALVDMLGYETADALKAVDPKALYADPERHSELWEVAEQTAHQNMREVELRRKDGSTFPGRVTGTVVRDEDEGIAYIDGVITDLTERKEQERELRLLQQVVEQVDEAVLVTEGEPLDSPGPGIEYINPSFTEMTGYELEEVKGKSPRFLQGDETDPAVLRRLRSRLEAEEQFEGEAINYRKDGTPYVNQWTITPVRDEDGTVTHWASIQRDVTDKRRVWKKLLDVQNQERRRIDQEIHDHMGGLLASIQMQLELVRMNVEDEDACNQLEEIEELVQEVSTVARTISRQLNPQILEDDGLCEALNRLTADVDLTVDLRCACDIAEASTVASVVTETAYRVVQESLLNVVEHADTDAAQVIVDYTDDELHVEVVDEGVGFEPEVLDEQSPSFGLNGVRDAVERLGGTFAVETAPGDGTRVTVTLPAHIAPVPDPALEEDRE